MRRTPAAGDGDGIGQGAQIVLNQSGNVITGSIGAITYFTIQINPATGVVTFTDNTANNLWHANTGNPDDPQTLTLANANLLQLVQTVTDADGDSDAAALNLGSGCVHGPGRRAGCGCCESDGCGDCAGREPGCAERRRHCVCDRELLGQLCGGETSAPMVPGSATYSLVLTGSNVASGLFALDAADTSCRRRRRDRPGRADRAQPGPAT